MFTLEDENFGNWEYGEVCESLTSAISAGRMDYKHNHWRVTEGGECHYEHNLMDTFVENAREQLAGYARSQYWIENRERIREERRIWQEQQRQQQVMAETITYIDDGWYDDDYVCDKIDWALEGF